MRGREDRRLVRLDEAVVLGVEDRVDRGQRDILVAAPVAGDEVGVEHFVVVGRFVIVVGDQVGGIDDAVAIDVACGCRRIECVA